MRLNRIIAILVLNATLVSADVIESFVYPPGSSIDTQNGGLGWTGAWESPGGLAATIGAASLTSGNLAVSGGSLITAGSQPPNQGSSVATWIRSLATPVGAANGATTYFSFLMRPDAGYGFYGGLNIGASFVGLSGNQAFYGVEGPGNDISLSALPVTQGQTVFFVLRADFQAGNDTLRLYLNPVAGAAEPGSADILKTSIDLGAINALTINNYGGFTLDELRAGPTFASVTPLAAVPEPVTGAGSLLLLAVVSARYVKPRTR